LKGGISFDFGLRSPPFWRLSTSLRPDGRLLAVAVTDLLPTNSVAGLHLLRTDEDAAAWSEGFFWRFGAGCGTGYWIKNLKRRIHVHPVYRLTEPLVNHGVISCTRKVWLSNSLFGNNALFCSCVAKKCHLSTIEALLYVERRQLKMEGTAHQLRCLVEGNGTPAEVYKMQNYILYSLLRVRASRC